ncbi:Fpg/Nei family DNA glycosylase [Paramicrobacterium agarici]|uniref:Fpg/Nei family DNA glycosylase n=1 Tax=Paramicrobacterium agarici TaxID=630514 RepID=UPI000BF969AB|nr:DNA-formamidopyrimidine glycosylase family protein [Microbacterium agarici]
MPELPEVHALAADLKRRLAGHTIERFDVLAVSALKTVGIPPSSIHGRTVDDVTRHGKFLDVQVGDDHIVIHLARAGWIRWRDSAPKTPTRRGKGPLAARLLLTGDDTAAPGAGIDITEAGTKKSLAISFVADPREVPGIARLGPDPLDDAFTVEVFETVLAHAGRAQIKGVLRNQSLIAGIGNAYSDEILHAARMSPFKPAAMGHEDAVQLYDALRSTLEAAVARADGLAAADLKREKKSGMHVHGRTGEACPVCGDTVRQVIFADSTFQYCPTCQTGGKVLADRVLSRLVK